MEYILLIISAVLVNNILLAQYLGNCPFLGVSKQMDTALGMGTAVVFTMTLASIITWAVHRWILAPFDLVFLQTIAFILVIASLVQFVEIFMKKMMEPLYRALGIFLPLITTNCAVLGVALLCIKKEYSFPQMVIFSFASGLGFALALVLFAGLRERYAISRIPKALEGTAIGLITAGFMSLAFFGFKGMT
ncbi:electron transport complex subunit RsxA [bacterium]|nr:electron transport complex subunit RsxA [candidate division CSSED10-310 bacterium]